MAVSPENREHVRQRFGRRCAYCGVHETDVGSELEIEHFHPQSKGGSDELDNLVYCCSACNRFKASYWPTSDTPLYLQPLNPLNDDLREHIELLDDGRLVGTTRRGRFHIDLIHLNRSQLVDSRRKQLRNLQIRQLLNVEQRANNSHQARIRELEAEVQRLQIEITLLRGFSARDG